MARRKARQLFGGRKYMEAAAAWSDWAATVPAGSWTVQIAAVNLTRAGSTDALSRLASRDEVFVLAPGALRDGLAPVCSGIYDSEEAARRAAASLPLPPGSTSRPLVKPVQSLLVSR
jgi:septal ring-binding cell division protein DamX